jgi:hypothetical protein
MEEIKLYIWRKKEKKVGGEKKEKRVCFVQCPLLTDSIKVLPSRLSHALDIGRSEKREEGSQTWESGLFSIFTTGLLQTVCRDQHSCTLSCAIFHWSSLLSVSSSRFQRYGGDTWTYRLMICILILFNLMICFFSQRPSKEHWECNIYEPTSLCDTIYYTSGA